MSLERRRPLSAMLHALARADAALGWQDLQQAAWPGEKLVRDAGAHRVRVAISTLRKLGLGSLLVTRDDGYVLSRDVPLFVEGAHD